ncbi:MAG: 30S ribosomal protein S20 [Elusimicrobiota bacterium]|jgi:small subunit ribosomal protein S20|nr:MAG: 30S ribosomal protein S20 [Elusimicrobiota bacterium]
MAKKKQMRHKSGLKAHRQSLKHAVHNASLKKSVRLAVRAVVDAAKSKDIKALGDLTGKASAALDKAAKAGTIHWKAAARKKSRLAAQVQKLTATAK